MAISCRLWNRRGGQGRLSCAARLTPCDSEAREAKEAKQAEEEGPHSWGGLLQYVECAVSAGSYLVYLVRSSTLCMQCICRDEGMPTDYSRGGRKRGCLDLMNVV